MLKSYAKLFVTSLLLVPAGAMAVPITVDFTVTSYAAWNGIHYEDPSYAGFAVGVLGGGSFSFDDSTSSFVDLDAGRVPTDLSFSWMGHDYSEVDARLFVLSFDAGGTLNEWGIGSLTGGCNLNCWANPGPTDLVILTGGPPVSPGGSASLHIEGYSGAMLGYVQWNFRDSNSVPEPATLGLLGLGLLGAGFVRRKRAA